MAVVDGPALLVLTFKEEKLDLEKLKGGTGLRIITMVLRIML